MQMDETQATQADFDFAKSFADTWCDGSQSAAIALAGKLATHRAFAAPPALSPTLHPADREAIARVAAAEGVKHVLTAAMMLEPPFNDQSSTEKSARLERVSKTIVAAILALSGSLAPAEDASI